MKIKKRNYPKQAQEKCLCMKLRTYKTVSKLVTYAKKMKRAKRNENVFRFKIKCILYKNNYILRAFISLFYL